MKPKILFKKKICLFVCFFSLFTLTIALNPVNAEPIELWNKTAGGSDGEHGLGVAVDAQGNIVVIGCTRCFGEGDEDFFIMKYDSNGNNIWDKTAGGGSYDEGSGVAVDSDDNIIVTGVTKSFGAGLTDVWTIKYDPDGNLIWNKTAGGGSYDGGSGIAVDWDNNIIVTGWTSSFGLEGNDVWTIKYDPDGNILWNKTLDQSLGDVGRSVAVDSYNNIVVAGVTTSFGKGSSDVWTIKYDTDGNLLWNKTVGRNFGDWGDGVAVDSNNNIIVTGYTGFSITMVNIWTIKYDPDGNILWNKTNDEYSESGGRGVAVDIKDNIIVTGWAKHFGAENSDVLMIKYDPDGNMLWNKTAGGSFRDGVGGVAVDTKNNIIVAGWTDSFGAGNTDVWLIKYATNETIEVDTGDVINEDNEKGKKVNNVPDNDADKEEKEVIKNESKEKVEEYTIKNTIEKVRDETIDNKTETSVENGSVVKDEKIEKETKVKVKKNEWKTYLIIGAGILLLILLFILAKKFKK